MAKNGMRVRGITIEISGDTTGLVESFKTVDAQLKRTQGNLGALTNYINSDNSWDGLRNKWNALAVQQNLLVTKKNELIQKIRMEQEALGSLADADPTPKIIEKQQSLQTQLILDRAEYEKNERQLKQFGDIAQQRWKAIGQAITESGEKLKAFGQNMMTTGRELSMYITTPVVGLGTAITKTSMDFETAMDKVQSVTLGATAEEMDKLREMTLKLSGDSKYSASEAAEALYYMGLAGWNTSKMMEALPDVLALATAGDLELGRASDIVTDYITAFGMSVEDTTRFVNVMAKTMVNSNTDVDQLGDAFKYVAPVAGSLGYTVEDVSLALGIMANNGIKASQAGTGLRQFMQRLVKPTKEVQTAMDEIGLSITNTDGSLKTFKEVLDNLRSSLGQSNIPLDQLNGQIQQLDESLENGEISEEAYEKGLTEIMKAAYGVKGAEVAKNGAILAGVRGMSGLLAIVNTTAADYENLNAAINGTEQSAQSIADIMLDNTEGAMLKLKHSVQNLGISFGEQLLPYVNQGIEKISKLVSWFSELDSKTKDGIIRAAGFAAAIGPVILGLGSLISALGTITSSAGSLVAFFAMHPIIGSFLAIGAVAVAVGATVQKQMEEIRLATYGLTEEEKELINTVNATASAWESTQSVNEGVILAADTEAEHLQELRKELGLLVDENNGRVIPGYEDRAEYILNELNEALGTEYELNGNIIKSYQGMQEEIDNLIAKKRALKILEQYDEEYAFAQQNQMKAYEEYALAQAAYAEAHQTVVDLKLEEVKLQAQLDKEYAQYGRAISGVSTDLANLRKNLAIAEDKEESLRDAMETSLSTYSDLQNQVKNYDEAYEAAMNGTADAANEAITKLVNGFQRFDTATRSQLEAQVRKYRQLYEQAKKDVAAGVAGISQATVDEYAKMLELSEAELEKYGKGAAEAVRTGIETVDMTGPGSEHMSQYAEGIEDNTKAATDAAETAAKATKKEFDKIDGLLSGKGFVNGIAKGIRDNIYTVEDAAKYAANRAQEAFNKPLAIKSPSKVMEESGKDYDEGAALGIKKNAGSVYSAAEQMAKELSSLMMVNPTIPSFGAASYGGNQSAYTTNYGGVTMIINQQPGESVDDLVNRIMQRIEVEVLQYETARAI